MVVLCDGIGLCDGQSFFVVGLHVWFGGHSKFGEQFQMEICGVDFIHCGAAFGGGDLLDELQANGVCQSFYSTWPAGDGFGCPVHVLFGGHIGVAEADWCGVKISSVCDRLCDQMLVLSENGALCAIFFG